MIAQFFNNMMETFREINRKYAQPHIKITWGVRFSLGLLRFYLLFLVGLMVYKFIITAFR